MGKAASLFYSTDDPENCLDYRVRPSDEQYDSQKERWNDLATHLRGDLAERSGYQIATWLQGSYKFGTQVRPADMQSEFDIDLGVYFKWNGEPEDGAYTPSEFKSFVNASLIDYVDDAGNDAEEVGEPKTRCERVHFSEDFHIDVPAYHLDQEQDARSLATEEDEWEESDPKAIYIWWKDTLSADVRPRARRLVRYMKMWAALKTKEDARPSSILLTVLTAERFIEIDANLLSGDDEYFREIVSGILDRLQDSTEVTNPVDDRENLNRLSTDANDALIDALEELLSIANRALVAPTKSDAADIWAEAFEHFFPIPSEEEVAEDTETVSKALALPQFTPQVHVRAIVGQRKIDGMNQIAGIPKGCKIYFTLANRSELPEGALVRWMVRNEGAEAESLNDLGHRSTDGYTVEESSAYRGTHHMDVSVMLNGRVIGRRRIPVQITGLGIPLRNPKRPEWTKFRRTGRRR